MTPDDTLELVRGYADRRHGRIGAGDPVQNAESFVWQAGYNYPNDDVSNILGSLRDSARELSLLTGLPPTSMQRIARILKEGQRAGRRDARREGRL